MSNKSGYEVYILSDRSLLVPRDISINPKEEDIKWGKSKPVEKSLGLKIALFNMINR
jgi:hypothetical protein